MTSSAQSLVLLVTGFFEDSIAQAARQVSLSFRRGCLLLRLRTRARRERAAHCGRGALNLLCRSRIKAGLASAKIFTSSAASRVLVGEQAAAQYSGVAPLTGEAPQVELMKEIVVVASKGLLAACGRNAHCHVDMGAGTGLAVLLQPLCNDFSLRDVFDATSGYE